MNGGSSCDSLNSANARVANPGVVTLGLATLGNPRVRKPRVSNPRVSNPSLGLATPGLATLRLRRRQDDQPIVVIYISLVGSSCSCKSLRHGLSY